MEWLMPTRRQKHQRHRSPLLALFWSPLAPEIRLFGCWKLRFLHMLVSPLSAEAGPGGKCAMKWRQCSTESVVQRLVYGVDVRLCVVCPYLDSRLCWKQTHLLRPAVFMNCDCEEFVTESLWTRVRWVRRKKWKKSVRENVGYWYMQAD